MSTPATNCTSFRLMNTVVFLNIKLIPRVICENGYTDIILLNIPILYSEGVRICNIELFNEFILRDHKKYRGIEIPQEMLSYLMKLKGGSPKPLFRAFDGFLSDRLELYSQNYITSSACQKKQCYF